MTLEAGPSLAMIMPAIRTVIADDEALARKKLMLLLGSEPGFKW
jgi:hypothetical protein